MHQNFERILFAYRILEDVDAVKRPCKFLQSIIIKWKEQDAVTNKPRMTAPRKIRPCTIAKLNKSLKEDPRTSERELVDEMKSIGVSVTRAQ